MHLRKFTTTSNEVVYLNPDHIVAVFPSGTASRIYLTGNFPSGKPLCIDVHGAPEGVLANLR